jgi:ATP-dependent Zn protease
MPGKISIKNISKSTLKFLIKSVDSKTEHSQILEADKEIELNTKGGIKSLLIYDKDINDKNIIWKGLVPSYGFLQITIDFDGNKCNVKYGDNLLVNLKNINLEENVGKKENNTIFYSTILLIIMLIFIFLFWYFY